MINETCRSASDVAQRVFMGRSIVGGAAPRWATSLTSSTSEAIKNVDTEASAAAASPGTKNVQPFSAG